MPHDPAPSLQEYADPHRMVTTEWLAENLGTDGLVVVECDEDVLLYDTGHIPGAVKVDWHLELNDQVTRDYLDAEGFAELCARKGIGRDDTVVFYGDNFNCGPRTRCGCSPCSATPTCGCSTAAGRSGSRRVGS